MWIDFNVFNILKNSERDFELKIDEINYIGQYFLSEASEVFIFIVLRDILWL